MEEARTGARTPHPQDTQGGGNPQALRVFFLKGSEIFNSLVSHGTGVSAVSEIPLKQGNSVEKPVMGSQN